MIKIKDKNTTYVQLEVDREEDFLKIFDFFSIKMPGAEFMPSVKMGFSDGKTKFITPKGELPFGLKNKLISFCKNNDIEVLDETSKPEVDITYEDFLRFVNLLDLPFEPYEHQLKGAFLILRDKRKIILSATGSGKSATIYIVLRYLLAKEMKCMLIVPTIDLVNQMFSDFEDYFSRRLTTLEERILKERDEVISISIQQEINEIYTHRALTKCMSIEENFAKIFGGQDKHTNHLIKISTYQSLSIDNDRVDASYFEDIDAVLIDETHKGSGKTIADIVKCSYKAKLKAGLTGSLGVDLIENLTIEGLLGSVTRVITMREMIDLGLATEVIIKPIFLKYPESYIKEIKKMTFQEEDKYIRNLDKRAEFLAKLACSFKDKNVLFIYKNIDAAEAILKNIIKIKDPERNFIIKDFRKQNDLKVYYAQGETKSAERDKFRGYLEEEVGCIMLGTTSIVATGLNIKNLSVLIFESIGKSSTLTIQGIGRSVRLHKDKQHSVIYDIVDDATHFSRTWKAYPNYKMKHWFERLDIYTSEEYIVDEPTHINLKFEETLF